MGQSMNEKMDLVKEVFETYRDDHGFSGAALIKSENDVLFQFCAGYENRAYKIENKLSTAFDTASITKLFTAAGIVLLESQGKISFEDDIHSLLDLEGTKIPKDVKIRHLLTHTSGIADDAEEEKGEDYAALFVDSPNYALRENKDFLKNFVYKEPNFKAGERICYNNCAFILLGLVIEKITHQDYRTFITEEIFKAFHMEHTFFAAKEDSDRAFAEGYFYGEDGKLKKNIYSFPPIGTADSGAYTTVEDLDLFMRTINSSEMFRKMMYQQTSVKNQDKYYGYTMGFAFELLEKEEKIIRAHKEGQNDGVCNFTAFYPQQMITFTILGNVDCDIWKLQGKVEEILKLCE